MDSVQLAWAAGLFDAEGSIAFHLPKGRHQRRPTMDVSQAGRVDPPHLLLRFRDTVGGGRVFGPYRGYLFYWRTHDAGVITATAALLWPWLGRAKRAQLARVIREVSALWAAEVLAAAWESHVRRDQSSDARDLEERAWAAGLFDGDGSIGAYRQRTSRSEYLVLSAAVVQAMEDGTRDSLRRFGAAVGAGSVYGPYAPRGWSRLPQLRWQLKGRRVESAVARIWPWLDEVKRGSAARAIDAAHSSFAVRRGTAAAPSR